MTADVRQIARFMELGGQNVSGKPWLGDSDLQEFRKALVWEEVHELQEAYDEDDLAGVVDAYCDIAVVALGGLIAHAGDQAAEELFQDVLNANLSKVAGEVIRDENGKILKPEGWEPPVTQEILDTFTENSGEVVKIPVEGRDDAYILFTKILDTWYVLMFAGDDEPNEISGAALEMLDVLAVGAEMARQMDNEPAADALAAVREEICEWERLNG